MDQNQVGTAVFVAERRSDLPGMRKHTFDENDNYEIICLRGLQIIWGPLFIAGRPSFPRSSTEIIILEDRQNCPSTQGELAEEMVCPSGLKK